MERCTPIIPVSDLAHAAEWFWRCLGMDMDDPRRQQSIYINVADVDAFFAAHKANLETSQKLRPPFNRDYGAREIHVIYESLLIFIGQPWPVETP